MKTERRINLGLIVLTIIIGAFLNQCQNTPTSSNEETTNQDNTYAAVSEESPCKSDWFPHSSTPAPAEGDGSPFDTSSTTNLIFHQWSWQKFLWATKPTNGIPLFEDSLTQVTNELIPITGHPMGASISLTDVGQAGSNGILISNDGYNGDADTVYYSIHANDKLLDISDSMKTVMLNDPTQLDNRVAYPVSALELKISWVKASAIPQAERSTYYQTLAYITTIGDTATVAFLGMHVTGVVKNHPEFIWATFEHQDMAPKYDWESTTDSDVPVTSSSEMLFFNSNDTATVKNIQWDSSSSKSVFTVFPLGIPKTAGGKFMSDLSQDSASNASNEMNIETLNECVASNLGSESVWSNYFYNGSIWANMDGLSEEEQIDTLLALGSLGNVTSNHIARGSLAAFNVTMETYEQCYTNNIYNMTSSTLTNCFSCHTANSSIKLDTTTYSGKSSPMYFSHIFRSYLSVQSGVSIKEIEKLRIQEFMQDRAKMKAAK